MKSFISPALFLLLVLTFPTATYSTPQTTTLEPGTPVEQTITGGETHAFVLTLAPGTYGLIELEQKGINLSLAVSADGQQTRTANHVGAGLPERLYLIAEGATQYRVEVGVAETITRRGSYTITLKDVHPATDQDKSRVEAEKLSEIALQLLRQNTPAARGEAEDIGFYYFDVKKR